MLEDTFKTRNVRYHKHLGSDLPPLQLDTAQIKQILINIVQNALQAMPEGGDLTIATRRCEPPASLRFPLGSARPEKEPSRLPDGPVEQEWVEAEIRDSGEGIPPENAEQVFSPFFTTKTYGTGLGLSICKKIVEDHAGDLRLESQVGEGTVVRITLPNRAPQSEG